MNVLVILQGPAYGDERSYNSLRFANNLKRPRLERRNSRGPVDPIRSTVGTEHRGV